MSVVDSTPHRALARRAAIEGLVLLKNTNNALPIAHKNTVENTVENTNKETGKITVKSTGKSTVEKTVAAPLTIAVVGPNANRTDTLTSNYAGCRNSANGPLIPECTFINPLQVLCAFPNNLNIVIMVFIDSG
jgi:beta-glucosidase-like glycosyl hydrolase